VARPSPEKSPDSETEIPIVIGWLAFPAPDEDPDEPDELHPAMTKAAAATPAAHRVLVRLLGLGSGFPWSFMAMNQPPDSGSQAGCRLGSLSAHVACRRSRFILLPARIVG
jgi:hypothetical protein